MTLFFLLHKIVRLSTMEIPVEMIWEINNTPRNRAIMERYKTLVTTHYKKSGQEGQFDDCTKDVLVELCEDDYSDAELGKNLRRILTLINI